MHDKVYQDESLRNPSPPPEISALVTNYNGEAVGDNIGNTLFSQHWLFQQLMDVIKYVDSIPATEVISESGVVNPIELDKKIEDSMCVLWDMSVEFQVTNFLMDFKAKDIFMGILIKTANVPRLQEIILGIIANMATHRHACCQLVEDKDFMVYILQTMTSSDSLSLLQTLRFLICCLAEESLSDKVVAFIKELEMCLECLKFILSSSLNVELLQSALKIVYECLDKDDDFITCFATEEYFEAILDAGNQIVSVNEVESLDEFWHLAQLMTTYSIAYATIAKSQLQLVNYFKVYMGDIASDDNIIPAPRRLHAITAALATINVFISNTPSSSIQEFAPIKDSPIMEYMRKLRDALAELCKPQEDQLNENGSEHIVKETLVQLDEMIEYFV